MIARNIPNVACELLAKEDNLEGTNNLLTCTEEGHEHLLHLFESFASR